MLYSHVNGVQRNKQGPPFQTLVRFAWLRFLWPHGYAKFSMYMQASYGTNHQTAWKQIGLQRSMPLVVLLSARFLFVLALTALLALKAASMCIVRCHSWCELDIVKPSHQNSKETSFSLGSLFFEALHIHKGKKAILHLTRLSNNGDHWKNIKCTNAVSWQVGPPPSLLDSSAPWLSKQDQLGRRETYLNLKVFQMDTLQKKTTTH